MDNDSDKLKTIRNDLKKVFDSEEGKRALKNIGVNGFADTSVFNKDPLIMAYNCGARDLYLGITVLMNMDIEELERISNRTTKEE